MDLTDPKTQAEILGVDVLMGLTEDIEIPVDISYKAFCDLVLQGCADKVGVKIGINEEPEKGETRWYLSKGEGLEKE